MIVDKYRCVGEVQARYVRKCHASGLFYWCEQSLNNPSRDIAQGTCEASDLPPAIVEKCESYRGSFYACEWPMEDKEKVAA